ncbi:MAG: glycosyltransferase family 1 protein [Actinomycetota bacterium]|nr:glycosyltransferase family 1 protein [Actinomycetota bacterium]
MKHCLSVDLSAVPQAITGAGRYGIEFLAAAQKLADQYGFEITSLVARGDSKRISSMTRTNALELIPQNRVARLIYEKIQLGRVLNLKGFSLHHGIHYTMPRGFHGKVVVTIHDTTLIDHPEWHERSKVAFFTREINYAARHADGLIFPSHFVERRFRELFDQNQPYQVIPHGVRTIVPPADIDLDSVVGSDAVEAGYFLYCGTIEPRKNLERIVEGYLKSKSKHFLVIVGLKGWNMAEFLSRFDNSERDSKIRILGFVDDETLASLYRDAICTLYPSLEEGFGLPGLEALAYGSPLITSKGSAMEEYAVEGVVLVDPRSVDEIADAMGSIGDRGFDRERFKALGVERSHFFTWERSGEAHLTFYKKVLEG